MGASLLAEYLLATGETQSAFADRAGVSAQALGDWLKGRRGPDITSAGRIEDATNGAVPIRSWERTDGRRAAPHPVRRVNKRTTPKQAS